MANRYAPGKQKFLTREPKCIVVRFTSNGSTGEQTLAEKPYNMGVVNVVASGTGSYKVNLGSSDVSRDSYAGFAGMTFSTSIADRDIDRVYSFDCNSATDPHIGFVVHSPSDGEPAFVSSPGQVFVRLYFLDSSN